MFLRREVKGDSLLIRDASCGTREERGIHLEVKLTDKVRRNLWERGPPLRLSYYSPISHTSTPTKVLAYGRAMTTPVRGTNELL
jgi:hypothetical protein